MIFFAAPILVASLVLLTVHSAEKDAGPGRGDVMVVQNVLVTLEVALLILLAFALRRNRQLHGVLLLSTALLFMGIAAVFTLISFVPSFQPAEPGAAPRFGAAAQASLLLVGPVALLMFLKNWRIGWPWLLVGAFFMINGLLQMIVAQSGQTKALTLIVASIGQAPAAVLTLAAFTGLLWLAWKFGGAPQKVNRLPL
jgi:hypothetical protein